MDHTTKELAAVIIGVPREVKNNEKRVGMTPAGVHELVAGGHVVLVQTGAGLGARIPDEDYLDAGARVCTSAAEVWDGAELVVKVKEPQEQEFGHLRRGLLLVTYLHLAADRDLTRALLDAGVSAIGYETVQGTDGGLPLLAPMSGIAGRLATQVAAYHLMAPLGGHGILMGGVPGTPPANVVVLGGGGVGEQAAIMARGLQADVTVMDLSLPRLQQITTAHDGRIRTRYSTRLDVAEQVRDADVVIGAVLVPGARAPRLVTEEMVATMKAGAVLVDVAIDQGGCFGNSRPTTYDDPTYPVHETIFYCVANMPASVPVTATAALSQATLPYLRRLADQGWREAMRQDPGLARGLNVDDGVLTNAAVGSAHGIEASAPQDRIGPSPS